MRCMWGGVVYVYVYATDCGIMKISYSVYLFRESTDRGHCSKIYLPRIGCNWFFTQFLLASECLVTYFYGVIKISTSDMIFIWTEEKMKSNIDDFCRPLWFACFVLQPKNVLCVFNIIIRFYLLSGLLAENCDASFHQENEQSVQISFFYWKTHVTHQHIFIVRIALIGLSISYSNVWQLCIFLITLKL